MWEVIVSAWEHEIAFACVSLTLKAWNSDIIIFVLQPTVKLFLTVFSRDVFQIFHTLQEQAI